MTDLSDVDLAYRIEWACDGDVEPLLDYMRKSQLNAPRLREFLINVIAGKIKLKRRKTTQRNRWLFERLVMYAVRREMGKQRNTDLRTHCTQKWCDYYGTTPNRVADFLKYGRTADKRRRSARK